MPVRFFWGFCLVCVLYIASPAVNAGTQRCDEDPAFLKANHLTQQGICVAAIQIYQDVLKKYPHCVPAQFGLSACYGFTGDYGKARQILNNLIREAESNSFTHAKFFKQKIQERLVRLDQDQRLATQKREAHLAILEQQRALLAKNSRTRVAFSLGGSDNINDGIKLDNLTFMQGDETITLPVADSSKPQRGSWTDLEMSHDRLLSPDVQLTLSATWRNNHSDDRYDLGIVRGVMRVQPKKLLPKVDPHLVVSGGTFFLDSKEYRQDIAVGAVVQPEVQGKKLKLGYQFADYNYLASDENDGRYHRVSVGAPVFQADEQAMNARIALDVGYRWPESTKRRLGDYTEASAKLRLELEPRENHDLSVSYTISKQQDAGPYNTLFGKEKRDLQQQVVDIGWARKLPNKKLSLEANVQYRETDSKLIFFQRSATDVTVGVNWELD